MTEATIDLAEVDHEETLIQALLKENAYPHSCQNIRLFDTHISWVILTGPYAYKIKKPLKLEFLDYSTLERRRHFCNEERRLNSRWAPDLYLDVVPITGSFDRPRVGGDGEAVEYAVKMRQFPQSAQLDVQLEHGLLAEEDMLALAEMIADKHGTAEICTDLRVEDARDLVQHPMLENIEHLQTHIPWAELEPLATWTSNSLEELWPVVLQRQDDGFIRECHGDLKLSNLVRLESGFVAFDCVEFNSALRDIDVISDISFLVMDLTSFDRGDLAYALLNRYLECTGDYAGMSVFALYYVYHALIRAKIAAIRSIERDQETDAEIDLEEMGYYCDVARQWIVPTAPRLILMHGYSGSGKTWLAQKLLARLPAVRLRSDVERKRILGMAETDAAGVGVGRGVYSPDGRRGVYARLAALAEPLLKSGHHAIVDASFLDRRDREMFYELAARLDVSIVVVDIRADEQEILRRLRERTLLATDASDADAAVLGYQFEHADPLDEAELAHTIVVDSDTEVDIESIIFEVLREPAAGSGPT